MVIRPRGHRGLLLLAALVAFQPILGSASFVDTSGPLDSNNQPIVDWFNPSGNQMGTATTPVRTDPTGTTVQPVSQNSPPWAFNLTQAGGTNISTGTGASGAGIPRVTFSNDSKALIWDGTNTMAVKPASVAPLATDPAAVVGLSPNGNQATAANQTNGTQKTQVVDGSGNVIGPATIISGVNYAPTTLAASGTAGAAPPARIVYIGGTDGTNLQPLQMKVTTNEAKVDSATADTLLSQIATNTSTANSDTIVNGNITAVCTDANINACGANSTVSISAFGIYTVTASITGTWVATVVIDGQYADNTWGKLGEVADGTTYAQVNQLTVNGKLVITAGGYQNIRARASAFTSGTVAVGLEASIAQKTVVALTIPNTWNYRHLPGAASTLVKTGAGVFHQINVNSSNNGTTTVYDGTNAGGAVIAAFSNTAQTPFPFDIAFVTGLFVVTTNATTDDTIMYQWILVFFLIPRRRRWQLR